MSNNNDTKSIPAPSPKHDFDVPNDYGHIIYPLMSFVFGFPVLVIAILCLLQQRNKRLQARHLALYQQQHKISGVSTVWSGFHSNSQQRCSISQQRFFMSPSCGQLPANTDSHLSSTTCTKTDTQLLRSASSYNHKDLLSVPMPPTRTKRTTSLRLEVEMIPYVKKTTETEDDKGIEMLVKNGDVTQELQS